MVPHLHQAAGVAGGHREGEVERRAAGRGVAHRDVGAGGKRGAAPRDIAVAAGVGDVGAGGGGVPGNCARGNVAVICHVHIHAGECECHRILRVKQTQTTIPKIRLPMMMRAIMRQKNLALRLAMFVYNEKCDLGLSASRRVIKLLLASKTGWVWRTRGSAWRFCGHPWPKLVCAYMKYGPMHPK